MNYDYIKVDPRAIKMLGGDEQDLLTEGFDGDLTSDEVNGMTEDVLTDDVLSATIDDKKISVIDKDRDVLELILQELREIKEILLGD